MHCNRAQGSRISQHQRCGHRRPITLTVRACSPQTQQHELQTSPSKQCSDAELVLDRRAALLAAASATLGTPLASQAAPAPIRPFCGVTGVVPPWAYSADWQESTFEYAGFQTWYRSLGKPTKVRKARSLQPATPTKWPLLVLHGGPGMPSRYLETLELLHGTGRQIVFYDQIGCGKSRAASKGKGPGLQRINPDLFIQEVEAVRQALNLERCHVVGHGWGGMLATAYLLQRQQQAESGGNRPGVDGVLSATLLATPPSWQALIQDRQDKARALGPEVWSALQQEDPASPEFKAALSQYERSYVACQQPVTPGCVEVSAATTSPSISKAMTGAKMFQAEGVLADWQLPSGSLAGLPVLVARGEREELSAASTQALLQGPLNGAAARLLELPGAGTMVHIDAFEPLLDAMEELMSAAEA